VHPRYTKKADVGHTRVPGSYETGPGPTSTPLGSHCALSTPL
jgi:hypothetical protein